MNPRDLIEKCKQYAIECHNSVNHLYDGKPYSVHLEMVYNYGQKYCYLLGNKQSVIPALAACWTHDTIEDCRQTYNDVKNACGEEVAEITYALTNEKGKTRKERANEKYYEVIHGVQCAVFVKLCDRLANVSYSKKNKSSMFDKYRKEHSYFKDKLYVDALNPMWEELEFLLS